MHSQNSAQRPLVRYWRAQGLRAVLYLDDGIMATDGREVARNVSDHI